MINKSILIDAFQLLDKSERKGAFVLVTLICLAGVCEFIALTSLMFVVSNITNPTGQVENKIFDYVSIIFSNVSHANFVLYAIIFTIFSLILVYSFNLFISHSCERYGASIQARMGNHLMNGILKIPFPELLPITNCSTFNCPGIIIYLRLLAIYFHSKL